MKRMTPSSHRFVLSAWIRTSHWRTMGISSTMSLIPVSDVTSVSSCSRYLPAARSLVPFRRIPRSLCHAPDGLCSRCLAIDQHSTRAGSCAPSRRGLRNSVVRSRRFPRGAEVDCNLTKYGYYHDGQTYQGTAMTYDPLHDLAARYNANQWRIRNILCQSPKRRGVGR